MKKKVKFGGVCKKIELGDKTVNSASDATTFNKVSVANCGENASKETNAKATQENMINYLKYLQQYHLPRIKQINSMYTKLSNAPPSNAPPGNAPPGNASKITSIAQLNNILKKFASFNDSMYKFEYNNATDTKSYLDDLYEIVFLLDVEKKMTKNADKTIQAFDNIEIRFTAVHDAWAFSKLYKITDNREKPITDLVSLDTLINFLEKEK